MTEKQKYALPNGQITSLSDEELLEHLAWQNPSDSAISEYLMEKYKPLVRRAARRLYLIGADKEDLLQEGMLGLFRAMQSYRPEKNVSFAAYAELCVTRQMYSAIAASRRKKYQPLNDSLSLNELQEHTPDYLPSSEEDPELQMVRREEAEGLLGEIFSRLSTYENRVLSYYMDGLDYLEIAKRLGKTAKSVDNALNRIRRKVSLLLEERKKI